MATFIKGDIVVIPFPFSDLSGSKRRPALVLADLSGNDILLCQITSQHTRDRFAVPLRNTDFAEGSLPSSSFIRSARIFTGDKTIIVRKTGTVKTAVMNKVVQNIMDIIR
ncbi:MAG: type II toxin-antitoxin system PemK/MazF family toxin [Flavobacteriaceae bacterium]|jgi:mRNA interferase MazF|nr:type II toxin-antitoxin system PemK/MazF family toxin [Flavobacteriaceae bacterium]